MTNRANFDTIGNDFSVRFGLDDLSGRAKANLLWALLDQAGVRAEIVPGADAAEVIQKAMDVLWAK